MFHVYLRRMYILLLLDGMFYICLLGSFGLKFCSSPTSPCCFSVCFSTYPLLKKRYWIPLLLLYYCLSLPLDLLVLLNIFNCSDAGYIYIYDCYIFLMNWPLYYYIMTFLSLVTIFGLKSILSVLSRDTPSVFWFPFAWSIFFHPFTWAYVCLLAEVSL